MKLTQKYVAAVQLLLDVAPELFRSEHFVLKGGTAINLFVRDLPRLSVDLDLVWCDHQSPRDKALKEIRQALDEIGTLIGKRGIRFRLGGTKGEETKVFFEQDGVQVKVEVNHVFRGTLLKPESMSLVDAAKDLFFFELELPVLAKDELYASKLVAALDRQHPRDIYDVHLLLEAEGISPAMLDCFVAYLAGHNRPLHEVVFAPVKNLETAFQNEFQGMTREPISLQTLEATQTALLEEFPARLNPEHREFLHGLAAGDPDWELLPFPFLQNLPAVRWKLENLRKLKKLNLTKFNFQRAELERKFRQARL